MSRHQNVVITRLRLGNRKCQLNDYLYQIGKHADVLCVTYNKPLTVSHFLIECSNNVVCSAVHAACRLIQTKEHHMQRCLSRATVTPPCMLSVSFLLCNVIFIYVAVRLGFQLRYYAAVKRDLVTHAVLHIY